ncbi:thiopurine S-methyltransferase [Aliikangiella sp. G2MR2-5]|uniref:thiopurine S-methyltransferase n=1 Tax=Aliikangiella sp. G2MR2-5 TaxID=2788943 RepID=UPI0018A9ECA0|nr:thiopurine S-methyltransferase [Aliikangiella sp. G2MR2-5]
MEREFWLEKWNRQEVGFHNPDPHPFLSQYAGKVFQQSEQIFVPLCGMSVDMVYLLSLGIRVVGCELSEKAVSRFFDVSAGYEGVQKPVISRSAESPLALYDGGDIKIWQGDYFSLREHDFDQVQAIYDRAALIALPENMRKNYVNHMHRLFPSAKLMLITLEYPQQEMKGPPFSVERSEVEKLFNFAQIKVLAKMDILKGEPKFMQRGLTELTECVYQIDW